MNELWRVILTYLNNKEPYGDLKKDKGKGWWMMGGKLRFGERWKIGELPIVFGNSNGKDDDNGIMWHMGN